MQVSDEDVLFRIFTKQCSFLQAVLLIYLSHSQYCGLCQNGLACCQNFSLSGSPISVVVLWQMLWQNVIGDFQLIYCCILETTQNRESVTMES